MEGGVGEEMKTGASIEDCSRTYMLKNNVMKSKKGCNTYISSGW